MTRIPLIAAALAATATLSLAVAPAEAAGPPAAPPGTHLMIDTASAPSLTTVRAWQAKSPYAAIGVYIPVAASVDDRYDKAQTNLTPAWVSSVRAGGWQVLPIYVGRQAPDKCTSRSFHYVSPNATTAAAQGRAAAADAAASAGALGLSAGAPVAYDMEAYTAGCGTRALRAFYGAWTDQLHALGRMSAVYGSRNSTITDVASLSAHGFTPPDAVWVATASGQAQTSSLPPLTDGTFAGKRLNQFNLGVTRRYGGIPLNIDESAVDDYVWDATAPSVVLRDLAPATARRSVAVSWSASDPGGSGVARYQVRTRHAAFGHRLGPWSRPGAASGARRRIGLGGGEQWCVEVRATDHAGNTSRWSHQTCTGRYLDQRALHASKGWHTARMPKAYAHSAAIARGRGRELTTHGPIFARAVGVVLRGTGRVEVRLGTRSLGTVSGAGLHWVKLSGQRHGVLHLRTTTRRKVGVDAVVALT